MKPQGLKDKLENLKKRDKLLRIIRNFFYDRDFLEIDPPILVTAAGMEPHLDPFVAEGLESKTRYFLPTSPEFYLKRVLASGANLLFSLCPSFRDEKESKTHSHQFLMLEWYRANSELKEIEKDCEDLLKTIESHFNFEPIKNKNGETISLSNGINVIELNDFFKEITSYSISELDTLQKWHSLAKSFGAEVSSFWTINDCFSFLMVSAIESEIAKFDIPVILKGYPHFQSALAEERADGFSDRFELFIGGVEIANAYNELRGKEKNLKRYIDFQNERKSMQKNPHPMDDQFFDAVEILPKSAGIAFGVDRFLSLLLNCPIQDCQNR